MRTGRNYVDVWVEIDENDSDCYRTLVEWEYDPHGGNEQCPYWFDCWVVEHSPDVYLRKDDVEKALKEMDIDDIMLTGED
jgi:hypothetical protein